MLPGPGNIYDAIFFEKIVSNVSLNTLIILAKISIWDGWLGPEFASAGEYNTAFKTQAEIFLC